MQWSTSQLCLPEAQNALFAHVPAKPPLSSKFPQLEGFANPFWPSQDNE